MASSMAAAVPSSSATAAAMAALEEAPAVPTAVLAPTSCGARRREAAAERAAGGRDAAEWRAERGGTCVAALQLLSDRAEASQRVLAVPCVCHGVCAWLGRC